MQHVPDNKCDAEVTHKVTPDEGPNKDKAIKMSRNYVTGGIMSRHAAPTAEHLCKLGRLPPVDVNRSE